MGLCNGEVTAAILAGGLGTRLRSVVSDRPKVLAPVAGRPYLGYLLEQLARVDVREVVLLVGYQAEKVRAALGPQYAGIRLHYSVEPTPLGTAGAVRLALPWLNAANVLLLNGDSYCDIDLEDFYRHGVSRPRALTMALNCVGDTSRYGRVELSADGLVQTFREKVCSQGPGWINAGIYLIERQAIANWPAGPLALERDVIPPLAGSGKLFGYRTTGRFIDIGTPESFAQAEAFFASLVEQVA